ncbi:hypothetical protein [Sporosarcina sp. resist]
MDIDERIADWLMSGGNEYDLAALKVAKRFVKE